MLWASRSENLKTLCIIVDSLLFIAPVSPPTSIIVFISSSVNDLLSFFMEIPKTFKIPREINVKIGITGEKNFTVTVTNKERLYAKKSGCLVEIALGVISPKTKRNIVVTTVAIPTPAGPNSFKAVAVKIEESRMFTSSFATRRVFKSFSLCCKSLPARKAFLSLRFIFDLSLNLFIDKKELSAIEKSIESTTRQTEHNTNVKSSVLPEGGSDELILFFSNSYFSVVYGRLSKVPLPPIRLSKADYELS